MIQLNPYINFNGNARQAMEFYQGIFGGKLTMNTYAEFHASEDANEANKIMHSSLETDSGILFMASDSPNSMEYHRGNTMSMSLSGTNEAEIRDYWNKLSDGATINIPLEKAPWGDKFGMLTDKFGVDWLVNIVTQRV